MKKKRVYLFLPAMTVLLAGTYACGTALDDYVNKPDPAYAYEIIETIAGADGTGYIIDMVSQQWRTNDEVNRTKWRHWLHVAVPKELKHSKAMLIIEGGSNGGPAPDRIDGAVASMAKRTDSIVGCVQMVPNEPLKFAGEDFDRSEDSIIAYSWDKYLSSGDDQWPLQLPMVKSAVAAMNTLQDMLGKLPEPIQIDGFVVAGASKRGWTTWLTAAVDKRVVAIVPIVIDMLNTRQSFRHHRAVYGFYAPAVKDYEMMGIFASIESRASENLMKIVDPYSYRDRLTVPKLLLNSAGDQFFLPDSWRFYYDDLRGEKYLRYAANCGHGLKETDAMDTATCFYEAILNEWSIPRYDFELVGDDGIEVRCVDKPRAVTVFEAINGESRDFRVDTFGRNWTSRAIPLKADGRYAVKVEKPDKGYKAFFVELTFDSPGEYPFKFTTGVKIVPDVEPFAGDVNADNSASHSIVSKGRSPR